MRLGAEIGSIEIGKNADLALVDTRSAFMTPIHDPVSALVYSALDQETSLVLIDGQAVMRNNTVLCADETLVRNQAQSAAVALQHARHPRK